MEAEEAEDEDSNPSDEAQAELALISAMSGARDPLTFNEAWNHPNLETRTKWRKAIEKEMNNMRKWGVWKIIPKTEVPSNQRLIGNKWVFKEK